MKEDTILTHVHTENGKIYVLPFAHLDLFWLGNREECLSRAYDGIFKAMELCREYPEFRYLIEDVVVLSEFVQTYPDAKLELLEMISRGQVEVGAKWAATTITQTNGEPILRNLMIGLREAEAICGIRAEVIHLGDIPGMTPQFPQMLAKSGIRYAVISRGGPKKTPLYHWKALDGSSVLTWYSPYCYSWGMPLANSPLSFESTDMARLEAEADALHSTSPFNLLMHYGMDLSVPRAEALQNLQAWTRASKYQLEFGTQAEFFSSVAASNGVPTLEGEIPTVWGAWPDCAFLDVTIHHASAERALLWAERMAAADYLAGRPVAKTDITELWKPLLESLDHNYSGNAPEEYHAAKNRLTTLSYQQAEDISLRSMTRVASEVERPDGSIPVVVFNPSSYVRTDRINRRVMLFGDSVAATTPEWAEFHLEDETGAVVPMQISQRRLGPTQEADIVFLAADVPALGYKSYYLRPGAAEHDIVVEPSKSDAQYISMSAESLHVRVCRQTGTIRICQADGTPFVDSIELRAVEMLPTNQTMQLDSTGRIFPFLPEYCELVREGEVCSEVLLRGAITGVPVQATITISHKMPRVDVNCGIDWPGRGYLRIQAYLKLPSERDDDVYTGVPFGANSFENIIPGSGPNLGDEVTADTWVRTRETQDWLLMSARGANHAVTVATDRKLVEFFDDGCAINFLSSMTPKWMQPEMFHPFAGHYETGFSICRVAKGDIDEAAWHGESRFMPLRAICSYNRSVAEPRQSCYTGMELIGEGIRLSCMKPSEDGNGVIVRLLECRGQETTASVALNGAGVTVWECDLLEQKLAVVDPTNLSFGPFEIKTLRF